MAWRPAQLLDIDRMVAISDAQAGPDIADFLTPDPAYLAENLAHAIIDRNFNAGTHCLQVYDTADRGIVAWTWLSRGAGAVYSRTPTAEAHMLHTDPTLSVRTRIQLVRSTLELWINWCEILEIPVLVSTTIRKEWRAFMRIHEQMGFEVRGSHAFKHIERNSNASNQNTNHSSTTAT